MRLGHAGRVAIVVRQATDDDVPVLARLRRRSHEERHEAQREHAGETFVWLTLEP